MAKSDEDESTAHPFRSNASKPTVFASALHELSVKRLLAGVRARRPLQVVIGEPGTGKTTLLRELLDAKPDRTECVFCFSSAVDSAQLLAFVSEHLPTGKRVVPGPTELDSFRYLAREACAPGSALLVLVDEAQHLKPSALDLILKVADWSHSEGACTILFALAGDEAFQERLADLRSQHLSVRNIAEVRLVPLNARQVTDFVTAQLDRSEISRKAFSAAAIDQVALFSRGLPRLINSLCGHALLLAETNGEKLVTEGHVRASAEDLQLTLGGPRCGHALLLARSYASRDGGGSSTEPPEDESSTQSSDASNTAMFAALDRRARMTANPQPASPTSRERPARSQMGTPDGGQTRAETPTPDTPRRGASGASVPDNGFAQRLASADWNARKQALHPPASTAPDSSGQDAKTSPDMPESDGPRGLPADIRRDIQAPLPMPSSDDWKDIRETPRDATPPAHRYFRPAAIAAGVTAAVVGAGLFHQFQGSGGGNVASTSLDDTAIVANADSYGGGPLEPTAQVATRSDAAGEPLPMWFRPIKAVAVRAEEVLHNTVEVLTGGSIAALETDAGSELEGQLRLALNESDDEVEAAAVAGRVDALRAQADRRRNTGDLEGALQLVEQAIGLAPNNPQLQSLREELTEERDARDVLVSELENEVRDHQAEGNYLEAMAAVAEALRLAPNDPELGALRDEIEAQHRGALERTRIARELAKLDGDARAELEAGDLAAAEELAGRALQLAPGHPALLSLKQQIETAMRQQEENARLLAELQRLVDEASSALEQGSLDSAVTLADAALALPGEGGSRASLREEANTVRAAALERQRVATEIERLKAEALETIASGDLDAADERLKRVLELSENDEDAKAMVAEIGELRAAIDEAQRIAEEVSALRNATRQALAAEDHESALESVRAALALSPRDPETLLLEQEVQEQHQAELERSRIAAEVTRLQAGARADLDAGEYDPARAQVDRALALAPDNTDLVALRDEIEDRRLAAAERARIEAETGRLSESARAALADEVFAEALSNAKEALSLSPDNTDLVALIEEIERQQQAKIERERIAAEIAALVEEARSALADEAFDVAEVSVERGLSLAAEDPALLELQASIAAGREAVRERERILAETESLREQAAEALAAEDHDAALELARQGLALSPENEDLLALTAAIETEIEASRERERRAAEASRLADAARAALESEAFDTAGDQLDQALALDPESQALAALKVEIEEARSAARERERIRAEAAELLAGARAALEEGAFETALEQTLAGLDLSPENAELLKLAVSIEEQRAAAEERQRIAGEIDALLAAARSELEAESYEPALKKTDEALALDPEHSETLTLRQSIVAQQAEAEERARVAAAVDQLTAEARAALALEQFDAAVEAVDTGLAAAPGNTDLLALRSEIEAAQAAFVERRRIASEIGRLTAEATQLQSSESFDAALARMDEALALAPEDAELQALRQQMSTARTLAELQTSAENDIERDDLERAMASVDEGLAMAADDPTLQDLRSRIEQLQVEKQERERVRTAVEGPLATAREAIANGELERAAQSVEEALSEVPDHPESLALRDEITTLQREEAARLEQRVAELTESAESAADAGKFDLAVRRVAEALSLKPESEELATLGREIDQRRRVTESARLRELAMADREAGQTAAALESMDRALALTPDDSALQALRADLQVEHDAAVAEEERMRQREELRRTALAQRSSGELAASMESVDRALALAPDDVQLQALRAELVIQQRTAIETQQVGREIAMLKAQAEQLLADNEYDAALETALAAITLSPRDQSLRQFYSNIFRTRQAAVREMQRIEALDRTAESIEASLNDGDIDGARAALDDAAGRYPDEPQIQALRSRLEVAERGEAVTAAPTPMTPASQASDLNPRVQALIQSANERVRLRDIASARLLYQAAVDTGAGAAATPLGMTYDPIALAEMGVVGIRPDPEKALHWYEIGARSGDPEADRRIEQLRSRLSTQ